MVFRSLVDALQDIADSQLSPQNARTVEDALATTYADSDATTRATIDAALDAVVAGRRLATDADAEAFAARGRRARRDVLRERLADQGAAIPTNDPTRPFEGAPDPSSLTQLAVLLAFAPAYVSMAWIGDGPARIDEGLVLVPLRRGI